MEKEERKNKFPIVTIVVSAVAFISVFFLTIFIFHPITVNGPSMRPTYHSGDILKTTISFDKDDLTRGSIVTFTKDSGKTYIKRIIGLPGEHISVKDGQFYINGKELKDYQGDAIEDAGILSDGKELTLGNNEYFCAGDNRNNSNDCRLFGPVSFNEIDQVITGTLFCLH